MGLATPGGMIQAVQAGIQQWQVSLGKVFFSVVSSPSLQRAKMCLQHLEVMKE